MRLMDDFQGRTIKGYELKQLIGEGGFGAVYRAYQPLIGREVAIKIILPQLANRPEFIRRFETEAQLIARLEHPHIVPLYDYWREPNGAYLVMRWLRGGSLQQALKEAGRWSIEGTQKVVTQIGEALAVAHRQGIIHRDIKVENILLDENGHTYLTDFGIAKDTVGNANITQNNAILGSPAYLSPEQIKGEEVTQQSDIYSMGILIYELLTGNVPFDEETAAALLYKHLAEPVPDISQEFSDIPPSINEIIQRATAKEPSDRYADILELMKDFKHVVRASERANIVSTDTAETAYITSTGIYLPEPENPYKGLRAFQQADSADFFGRETLTQQLINRLKETDEQSRFLAVIGPSGSGKSSVVKAGLLPAIRNGALPNSDDWFVVEMVPGADPMEELEAALLRVAVNPPESLLNQLNVDSRGLLRAIKRVLPDDDTELVLFIDQFEELFTLVDEEDRRAHFMDSLLEAISEVRSRIRIIITLRADFYDRPLNYVTFGELIRKRTEVVLPLSTDELEMVITGPAHRVGMIAEPSLVGSIISDVREQPGALPLLQYALTELFERRDGNRLTATAYAEIGGTWGALARRADELYDGLDEDSQEATRQLFLRLVTLGEGTEDTRRRTLQSELMSIGDDPDTMSMIIDAFGRYRLLTFDHDPQTRSSTVEVAHEALIRQWGRLRQWLLNNREELRLQRRLTAATEEWENAHKDDSFLVRGARLQQLEEWMESTDLSLNENERSYLNASIAVRERTQTIERERQAREEALEKRSQNRLRALVAVMGIATVIAVILASVAFTQGEEAQDARATAENNAEQAEASEHLANSLALAANARNALIENNTTLALSLALEADNAVDSTPIEVLRILASSTYGPGVRHRLQGHEASVINANFSRNSRLAVSTSLDGTIRIWDNISGETVQTIQHDGLIFSNAVFTPQGSRIVAGGLDGIVYIFDVESGEELRQFIGHEDAVMSVAVNVDGTRIASGSLDHTVRIWDMVTGQEQYVLEGHTGVVLDVALSADGLYAVSSSADELFTSTNDDVEDRTVRVWDLRTGEQQALIQPPPGYIRTIAIGPESNFVLSGTWNSTDGGVLNLWDIRTGRARGAFYGHTDIISGVGFSPDSNTIYSTSWDRTLRVWDVSTAIEIQRFEGFDDRLLNLSISSNGEYALLSSGNFGGDAILPEREAAEDTSIWLIDLKSRDEIRRFEGSDEWIWSMDISSDDRYAVSGSGPLRLPGEEYNVRLWDVETAEVLHTMDAHTATVEGVAFSPDDSMIASGGWDGQLILWDVETGALIRQFGQESGSHGFTTTTDEESGEDVHTPIRVNSVAFHPDGTILASSAGNGTIVFWDVNSGDQIRLIEAHSGEIPKIEFSPDGTQLISASADQTVVLWDTETGEQIRQFVASDNDEGLSHDSSANDVTFSPDGSMVLSSSWDSTLRLWDVATGTEINRFAGHSGATFGVDFSPDGQSFVSGGADTTVRVWDIASGQELIRYNGHQDWVSEIQFTSDGNAVIVADQKNIMIMWQVPRNTTVIREWGLANRYVRDLTCAEREQYRIEPLCEAETSE